MLLGLVICALIILGIWQYLVSKAVSQVIQKIHIIEHLLVEITGLMEEQRTAEKIKIQVRNADITKH